ncbi:MAG: nucleotide exchange factor GrpE [Bacillota bacterium]|nr:nucleotide exchange factor GrpE [Bacillota bacterium]
MVENENLKDEELKDCCREVSEPSDTESVEEAEVKEDEEFEGIEIAEQTDEKNACCEELRDENLKLKNEVERLNNEMEALKDRLLRTSAEYDNFRKRTSKEKEGIYTDSCIDILKTMLPVLDNLERAATAEGSVEDLKKGIDMTIRQFKDSLERLRVEEIPTEGEFDPNLHNAVMHVEDEGYGKSSVVEVFQKGYTREGKVIRHSMVKVAN